MGGGGLGGGFPEFMWRDVVRRAGCGECWTDTGVMGIKLRAEAVELVRAERSDMSLRMEDHKRRAQVAGTSERSVRVEAARWERRVGMSSTRPMWCCRHMHTQRVHPYREPAACGQAIVEHLS